MSKIMVGVVTCGMRKLIFSALDKYVYPFNGYV